MHIVDTTLFFAPSSGGVKRYLLAKHDYLKRQKGVRHTIVVPGSAHERPAAGVVVVTSPRIPWGHGYRVPLSINDWADVLCALEPDVIEAGDPYHLAWSALEAAQRLDVPAIAFAHSDLPRVMAMHLGTAAGALANIYLRKLYNRFALITAPSRTIASRLHEMGIERVAVQPLGVDTQLFHPSRRDPSFKAELGLAPDARVLMYAGRLSAEKRIPILGEMAAALGAPYHVVIVGGTEKKRVSPHLTYLPYEQDTARLARLLASADALVHAGEHETFGLVFLEAMACGRPVIGVRSGAIPEIIDNSVGRVAEPYTVEQIAGAVRDLFADDVEALGRCARRTVEQKYAWEPVFRQQLARYAHLVQSRAAPDSAWARALS